MQTPASTPTPTPQARQASHREGLWAGAVDTTGLEELHLPIWIGYRVIPGKNPDVDRWRFEGGELSSVPDFQCRPDRQEDGWVLADCTRFRGLSITAFVPAEGDTGLEVKFDLRGITFGSVLTRVLQRDEPQASDNVSLVWHEPGNGTHTDIWAADGLVFAPRYFDGAIEILDAKSGQPLGTARIPGSDGQGHQVVLDVKARDGILYAATASQGLVVFDVSQPGAPELIGQLRVFVEEDSPENFDNVHNIFLSPDGNFVYAINQSFPASDLRVIDVSDPTSPKEAGRFSIDNVKGLLNGTHDINVIERDGRLIAFLNYLGSGLWILDVTDPGSISALGSIAWDGIFSHSGWPFAVNGKLYFAHTEEGFDRFLTVLDVTDLTSPRVVSHFQTRQGTSVHNLEVVDGIAYISYYIDGLRVVDLRDPENPREIGHYDTVSAEDESDITDGAWGVRVLEGLVYISDMATGTYAFNVDLQ